MPQIYSIYHINTVYIYYMPYICIYTHNVYTEGRWILTKVNT